MDDFDKVAFRPTLRTTESLTTQSVGGCFAKTCLYGCGGLVGVVSVILSIFWPTLMSIILQSQLSLSPGSRVFNMWAETPIPMYQSIYLYNWTNPQKSLTGGEKPHFTEMGPYTFYQHYSKRNITYNDNNTMTYLNRKLFKYSPERSKGSLDDLVTNLNVIAFTIGFKVKNIPVWEKVLVNELINWKEKNLLKTDTVRNLLFEGSEDPLLKLFVKLKPIIKSLSFPDKFGFFYQKNQTDLGDGVFTMNTGVDDVNKLGLLTEWNYENRTVFPGECGRVHGSYGEQVPLNTAEQEKVYIFANDLCSVIPLTRSHVGSVHGIPTMTFLGKEDTFSNETTCYCSSAPEMCPPSGGRDVSACQGAPIVVSWPHFYLADSSYLQAIDGVSPPNASEHSFIFQGAQILGTPVSVTARMQINLQMDSVQFMPIFKNIPRIVMPLMWFSQSAEMTPELASQMNIVVVMSNWGRWIALGVGMVGALLIVLGIVLQARGCFRHNDDRLLE